MFGLRLEKESWRAVKSSRILDIFVMASLRSVGDVRSDEDVAVGAGVEWIGTDLAAQTEVHTELIPIRSRDTSWLAVRELIAQVGKGTTSAAMMSACANPPAQR